MAAPSGIGMARPSFVSNPQIGASATPPIPTLNPSQFGAAPNWSQSAIPKPQSALLETVPGAGATNGG